MTDNPVVKTLQASKATLLLLKVPSDNVLIMAIDEALPLARLQAEKVEALEWLVKNQKAWDDDRADFPPILKSMLEKEVK